MTTRTAAILIGLLLAARPASAQESAPVMVDASPSAAELLRRAEESAAANPAESARLVQEVLDGFARKLVPWPPEADRYRSAAAAAEDFLRTHPAVRERWLRQESPTAERAVAAGELIETVRARAGTAAALQAMCVLAQRAMDDGRTFDARAWISRAERHPMVDDALRARLAQARAQLEALDRAPVLAPPPSAAGSATDWQQLWSVPMPHAWLSRGALDLENGTVRRMSPEQVTDGTALAMQPRIHRDAVLVADGAFVHALDRFGGSLIWRAQVGSASDRSAQAPEDLAVAMPLHDLVVTLPGHAQPEQRSSPPRVVALDRATGRRRWELAFTALKSPEFEDLFPHGDPVAVGDLVVVQARRSNSRLESAAWLLAIDSASGALRWSVPLGAAGGMRLAASRPLSSPVALGDDLVAASSLGVVTRLDGATGETRWLRRWPAPIREPRTGFQAWQLPSPVADDRLVAWLAPDGGTLVGLDPADGHTLWKHAVGVDTPFGAARTLLLTPDRLLAIGDDVVAIDRADPSRVAWSLDGSADGLHEIRGSVSLGTLADGSLAIVVPTAAKVLFLAPSDGSILGTLALEGGANTALAEGQLALGGAQSVSLAMQATDGERLLRDRLAADPMDARRGLALLELGRGWKRGELVLDGAIAATSAVKAAAAPDATVRDELVRRLIDPATLGAVTLEQADRLLQLAAGIAETPTQRGEVTLTRASRAIAAGRASEGIEALRALLADEQVGRAPVRVESTRTVAAAVLALQALERAGDAASRARLASWRVSGLPVATPRVGALEAAPRALPGSLPRQADEVALERPPSDVLMQESIELVMRRAPDLSVVWRAPFVGSDPVVASWSPALVIWSQAGPDNGRVVSLDPGTGRVRFQIDGVAALFESGPQAAGSDAVDRGEARALDVFRTRDFLVLQRGDGQLLGLRLDGDGRVAWRATTPVRLVRAADSDNASEALAVVGDGADEPSEIAVVHAQDGSPWLQGRCPSGIGRPIWTRLVPQGLVVGGSDGVALLERTPGLPLRWLQQDERVRGNDVVAKAGRWIVTADGQRRLTGIAVDDGELRPGFLQGTSSDSDNSVAGVTDLGDRWLVHRLHALTLHGSDGPLQGQAVGAPTRRHDDVALARDLVIGVEIVQPDPVRGTSQTPEFAVRRYAISEGLRQLEPPLVVQGDGLRLVRVQTVEGWVLLGGDDRSVAIPAPPGRDLPR